MTNAVEFNNVTKKYRTGFRKTKTALSDFSLAIREGEVFGFLGPNGAGKSTAIKILLNLIFPTSGSATISGKDVGISEVRRSLGYLPENPYFYDYLSPLELLDFAGKTSGMNRATIIKRSEVVLNIVSLWNDRKRAIRHFSKGMVQRTGLALSLIHDPSIVILDEPMTGLDPMGRKQTIDLILRLKSEGKTVFFSSHILQDIERVCDRVGILVNGKLVRLIDFRSEPLQASLEDVFLSEVGQAGGVQQ
jgi:ABC-2 type transport system ATP-binding protein